MRETDYTTHTAQNTMVPHLAWTLVCKFPIMGALRFNLSLSIFLYSAAQTYSMLFYINNIYNSTVTMSMCNAYID